MKKKLLTVMMAMAMLTPINMRAQEMTYSPAATRFALWSPKAEEVRVNVYSAGEGGENIKSLALARDGEDGTWSTIDNADLWGKFYTFQVKYQGRWLDETPGTDARAVGINGHRAAIINFSDTNPAGWANDRSPVFCGQQNAVIYEMHHRDFSIDPSSGIRHGGKFRALTETGTLSPEGLATGIDHLKELGVTHVHILPSYDYGSIDETTGNAYGGGGRTPSTYNWGYDPVNYSTLR